MKRLLKYFVQGLTAMLPAVLTVYILWWFGVWAEGILGDLLRLILPEEAYLPGFGLVTGVVLVVFLGMLLQGYVAQRLNRLVDWAFEKAPLVKTIYGGIRDVLFFFGGSDRDERLQQVVMVRIGNAHAIGFVTRDDASDLVGDTGTEMVGVFVPMGYQLGGFLIIVPRSDTRPLAMSVGDGLRMALTAGVQRPE